MKKRELEAPKRPKKKSAKGAEKPIVVARSGWQEFATIVFVTGALFVLGALASHYVSTQKDRLPLELSNRLSEANWMGPYGDLIARGLVSFFGICGFVFVFWALVFARTMWTAHESSTQRPGIIRAIFFSGVLTLAGATATAVLFGASGGGSLGLFFARLFVGVTGELGTLLLTSALFLSAFVAATGMSVEHALDAVLDGGQVIDDEDVSNRGGIVRFRETLSQRQLPPDFEE